VEKCLRISTVVSGGHVETEIGETRRRWIYAETLESLEAVGLYARDSGPNSVSSSSVMPC